MMNQFSFYTIRDLWPLIHYYKFVAKCINAGSNALVLCDRMNLEEKQEEEVQIQKIISTQK